MSAFVSSGRCNVNKLVLQDTEQPGFLRGLPLESFLGLHGRQECLLNKIFGNPPVFDPGKRKMRE